MSKVSIIKDCFELIEASDFKVYNRGEFIKNRTIQLKNIELDSTDFHELKSAGIVNLTDSDLVSKLEDYCQKPPANIRLELIEIILANQGDQDDIRQFIELSDQKRGHLDLTHLHPKLKFYNNNGSIRETLFNYARAIHGLKANAKVLIYCKGYEFKAYLDIFTTCFFKDCAYVFVINE